MPASYLQLPAGYPEASRPQVLFRSTGPQYTTNNGVSARSCYQAEVEFSDRYMIGQWDSRGGGRTVLVSDRVSYLFQGINAGGRRGPLVRHMPRNISGSRSMLSRSHRKR